MDDERVSEGLASETTAAAGGAGVGLIVGSLAGGPVGAIAGAAAGPPILRAFRRLEAELASRGIGRRQGARIGVAGRVAIEQIAERLRGGEDPRADFLDEDVDGRTTAEELLEETTRVAGESADERKLPLIGRFYASILFAPDVSAAHARYLHRLMERLTFRQLVGLASIAEATDSGPDPLKAAYEQLAANGQPELDPGVALEMDDLADAHLIGVVNPPEKREERREPNVGSPFGLWQTDDPEPIWQKALGRVRATPMGHQLAALYKDGVGVDDRSAWLSEAWGAGRPAGP